MNSRRVLVLAGLAALVTPTVVPAQSLGTFRWQIQPYCNVLSLSVVQQGGIYVLNGADDQCGAPQQASVVGLAFPNPDGTIGFGLTVVTAPGGAPVHIDATITLAALSGSWRDSAANSGAFVFTPGAGIAGAPRPAPASGLAPGSVTMAALAPGSVGASQLAPGSVGTAAVANGSLTRDDLADPTTAYALGGNLNQSLSGVPTVFRFLLIDAPVAGRLIAFASGNLQLNSAGADTGRCSIVIGTDPPDVDDSALILASSSDANGVFPFAATRGFTVAAGIHLIRLVCDVPNGAVIINDPQLTAIFVAS
jgi:hypothetical protein